MLCLAELHRKVITLLVTSLACIKVQGACTLRRRRVGLAWEKAMSLLAVRNCVVRLIPGKGEAKAKVR